VYSANQLFKALGYTPATRINRAQKLPEAIKVGLVEKFGLRADFNRIKEIEFITIEKLEFKKWKTYT